MSRRVWFSSVLAVAVILVAWVALLPSFRAEPLRSEHSDPAAAITSQQVAVTQAGKLFHKPDCRFIHGKSELMSEQEAIAEGYTPDPRCLKEDLAPTK